MQRLSSAFYSLDNLLAKITDNTIDTDTSHRKSTNISTLSQLPSELEPDGKIRRLSLPPESHPPPSRRNSAVQSILRRTKSKDVVNRFSAYLGRPRSHPHPRPSHPRPLSEYTISSPFHSRQGSSAWLSCSESLAQTSLRSDSTASGDMPTYGQTNADKPKSATPYTAYPILVTVHCPSSDESVERLTTKKVPESWPYEHPHPLRSNPHISRRPVTRPAQPESETSWRNRRVSFQADLYHYRY